MATHDEIRKTAIDKIIFQLFKGKELIVKDPEQIKKILIAAKTEEELNIRMGFNAGYMRLYWDDEQDRTYYLNQYGKREDTKEERKTTTTDRGTDRGTVRDVQSVREIEPIPEEGLCRTESGGSDTGVRTSTIDRRIQGILSETKKAYK